MKYLGLIGYPLGHSFSKKYFSEKFENQGLTHLWQYDLYPIETADKIEEIIENNPNIVGLNVTIPHKETVIPFLDSLDEDAANIGAVNCIRIENGHKRGYNTDFMGFESSLLALLGSEKIDNALILGTGGAAKAVAYVLKRLNISYKYVSRKAAEGLTYADLTQEVLAKNRLIINATPLGTTPNVDNMPDVNMDYIGNQHFLYDLVYNPLETRFLREGKNNGAKTMNGLEMLHGQAEAAWKIWNK